MSIYEMSVTLRATVEESNAIEADISFRKQLDDLQLDQNMFVLRNTIKNLTAENDKMENS